MKIFRPSILRLDTKTQFIKKKKKIDKLDFVKTENFAV